MRSWRAVIVKTLMDWGADLEALKQKTKMQDDKIDYLLNRINKVENRCADLERDRLRCSECGKCDGGCQE